MDRDIALAIADGLSNIKDTMTALATNTIPVPESPADALSISPGLSTSVVQPIEEPESIPEEPKSNK